MKITMTPKSRSTENEHTLTDETIKANNVRLEKNGKVTVTIAIGPINTSGEFKGQVSLSLSELFYPTGILEEEKLELLLKQQEKLGN